MKLWEILRDIDEGRAKPGDKYAWKPPIPECTVKKIAVVVIDSNNQICLQWHNGRLSISTAYGEDTWEKLEPKWEEVPYTKALEALHDPENWRVQSKKRYIDGWDPVWIHNGYILDEYYPLVYHIDRTWRIQRKDPK